MEQPQVGVGGWVGVKEDFNTILSSDQYLDGWMLKLFQQKILGLESEEKKEKSFTNETEIREVAERLEVYKTKQRKIRLKLKAMWD